MALAQANSSCVDGLSMIATLAALALSGWFDAPSAADAQAERERCEKSAICRVLVDDRPAILFTALSDEQWCVAHATHALEVLQAKGIPARIVGVWFDKDGHKTRTTRDTGEGHVYVVATIDGTEWVVDNGALFPNCDRVCRRDEAEHGVGP